MEGNLPDLQFHLQQVTRRPITRVKILILQTKQKKSIMLTIDIYIYVFVVK